MIEKLILLIFIILLIYYVYFLSGIYKGLGRLAANRTKQLPNEFVSIIIPFRNESNNILSNLRSLENQLYPDEKFEVIYVNDNSIDDSNEKLKKSIKKTNIKVVTVPQNISGNAHKKRAIEFGIENAIGEIIVTTDADCIHTNKWLIELLSYFDEQTGFISGPVEFNGSTSIFGKLQKIEFAGLVLAGAGLIGINKPVICNAANIAYRKKAFDSVNGYDGNYNLSSGDDELLMQKIWKDGNFKVKFCINKDAVVKTNPNHSLKQFYQQRKRWASKGLFYADKFLILKLIFLFLFYIGLILQFILGLLISQIFIYSLIFSFLLKTSVEFLILNKGKRKLFPELKFKYFLLAEILHIPYIIISGLSGITGNFVWKDRKIKR